MCGKIKKNDNPEEIRKLLENIPHLLSIDTGNSYDGSTVNTAG